MNLVGLARFSIGALACIFTASATADDQDLLSVNAGVTRTDFYNLFKRASDGSSGSIARDQLTTTRVTITARKSLSLQAVELSATLTDNSYRRFSTLDSQNNSFNAAWRWQVTPLVSGVISSSRQQSQSDFADFRGAGQNLRTTETKRANADWKFFGGWALGSGVTSTKQTNSQTFAEDAGNEQRSADLLIRYVFPSSTSMSFTHSWSNGDFLRDANPVTLSDSRFSDTRDDFTLYWPISGKTKLTAGVGRISRHYENFAIRDYVGRNGNLSLVLALTGKSNVTVTRTRATDSWQDDSSSFSVRNAFGISGSVQVMAKVSVSANLGRETRTFGGFALVPSPTARLDKSSSESIGLNWMPIRNLSVLTSIQRSRRISSSAGLGFSDKTASISASASF